MKRVLQITIVVGFLGGFFLLFDNWHAAAATVVLLLLVIAQMLFLASKTTVKRDREMVDPARIASVIDAVKKAKRKAGQDNPKTEGKLTADSGGNIDSEMFSEFQRNLSRSRRGETEAAKAMDDEKDVVVSLSAKGRRQGLSRNTDLDSVELAARPKRKMPDGSKGGKKSQLSIKKQHDSLDSIFDNIAEPEKMPSANMVAKTKIDPQTIIRKMEDIAQKSTSRKGGALIPNERLTSEDFDGSIKVLENEAEMVLSVASKAYRDESYEEGLATIRKWFQNSYKYNTQAKQNGDLLKLKADCEFALLRYEEAADTYQEYFTKHLKSGDGDYMEFLDGLVDSFTLAMQQHYAVPFYFTALNEHRKVQNHGKMDWIYSQIETAYRNTEDWARLIQTYQNHISIKKMLKDYEGQLDILNHLGKLQYDQGDAAGSKKSYELSIAIKNEANIKTKQT